MSIPVLIRGERGASHPYLSFRVGDQWYAVDVDSVFEVSQLVAISEVPDMPPAIVGMVNIRGQVVPVVDLRIRFGTPGRSLTLTTPLVFLKMDEGQLYGVIVDDVDDVINIHSDNMGTTSMTKRAPHLVGLTDHNGRLLMVLDPEQLMSSTLAEEDLETLMEEAQDS